MRYYFVWTQHHLIIDGWCLHLLLEEGFTFYQGLCRGQENFARTRASVSRLHRMAAETGPRRSGSLLAPRVEGFHRSDSIAFWQFRKPLHNAGHTRTAVGVAA
jgi:hypothetical protein